MKVVDLFSGCGGMSLGFQKAGFEVVAAYDFWEPCVRVYRDNFKHPIHFEDLREKEVQEKISVYNPDIIIGGPPCQDFSSAGKRKESHRADLTVVFAEIVTNYLPSYFIMENVQRITKSKALRDAKSIFKESGYNLFEKVIDASFCGVPQKRKRYFLFGSLEKEIDLLSFYLDKNFSQEEMSVHDYLGDKLKTEFYYRHPRSYARRGIFSIYEPSPTIRGVNRPIPKAYKKHKNDKSKPSDARALTSYERSLIQTFPEDFKWQGNKTDQELMIGNAVPVELAHFVGKSLKEFINDSKRGFKMNIQAKLEFDEIK